MVTMKTAGKRLEGKRAVVTGANRGIGKAIALGFAKEGADVVIGYGKDKEAALVVVKDALLLGVNATLFPVDMTKSESIAHFFKESADFLGDVDILVNNAGVLSHAPFLETTEADLDRVMTVNLKGPYLLLQQFANYVRNAGHQGSAINVSSISAHYTTDNLTVYQCSKAALSMLTKGAALELSPYGIRVNTLCPGLTATDLNRFLWGKDDPEWKERAQSIPLGRTGIPEDHVGAAIFLASDESSWMTGSSITVDGGVERR